MVLLKFPMNYLHNRYLLFGGKKLYFQDDFFKDKRISFT